MYNGRYMDEARPEHEHDETGPIDGIQPPERQGRPRESVIVPVVAFLAITALLVPIFAYLHTRFLQQPETEQIAQPQATTTPEVPSVTLPPVLHMERYNVAVNLPEGWQETVIPAQLPPYVAEPSIALTHPEARCTVVYATLATEPFKEYYLPTREEEDMMRADTHVTRIEYRTASDTAPVADDGAVPRATSTTLAYAYYPLYYDNGSHDTTRNAWVAYSSNNEPLSERCMADFRTLTGSLVREFTIQPLSRNDVGLLYLETHPEGTLLLFRSDADSIARVVTRLDGGAIFKPTLHDGTITFIGTAGTLRSYTLFANVPAVDIPLSIGAGESVNDFRVLGNTFHYLAGPWCRTNETPCSLDLMRSDRTTGVSETIETDITAPALDTLSIEEGSVLDASTIEMLAAQPSAVVHSLRIQDGSLSHGPELFEGSAVGHIPLVEYE